MKPWEVNRLTLQQVYWLSQDAEDLQKGNRTLMEKATARFMQEQDRVKREAQANG